MANDEAIATVEANGSRMQPGLTQTEGFGETAMTRPAETASASVAAQATAEIQSRYVVALERPRDWDTVRVRLLKECARPGFADVARYHKPVGKGVEGPSIRFAEAAMRCMANVQAESRVLYDDAEKRIVRVTVTDLEANLPYATDIVIEKTVERSSVKPGQEVIRTRLNSRGGKTYLVAATEDDLLNKQNALVSKALRTNALRILPGDILDECMDKVVAVQRDRDAKDPDAAKKRLVDGFAQFGVMPSDIKVYLGHDVATITPLELTHLRALFAAIRDGEATWVDALEHKTGKTKATDAAKAAGNTVDLKSRVKDKAKAEAPTVTVDPVTGEVETDEQRAARIDRGE